MTVESGGTSTILLLGAMIGLVGLAVLLFVGTLGYLRRQDRKQEGAGRDRRQQEAAAAADKPARQPEMAPSPAPELSTRQGEVMRVLRDPSSSRVLVEVGGRRYERLREIEDAQVGRRVLWAIADLVRFTGGMATNPRAVRSAVEGVAWDEDAPGAASSQAARRPSLPPVSAEPAAVKPVTTNLGQTMGAFFRRGLNPVPSELAADEPGTFIEEIDAILQAKMLEMDVPPSYELHVSAGPERRLQIQVGREVYGSIDEVPNLQARALIQAAVDEWEQR
jgi:hypothetical protein